MKIVEYAIYEKLKELCSGKVYALRAPDNTVGDFIIFSRTDTENWRSINNPSGIAQATIQIDCYGKTYYTTKAIASSVETILDGFSGVVPYGSNSPQDTITLNATMQGAADLYDQTDEPFMYRVTMDFLVTFEQE